MALIDSLPIVELEINCEFTLKGELAKCLVENAERFGKEPVDLLADVVEKVLKHDLIDVVLMASGDIDTQPKKKTPIKLDANTPSLYDQKHLRV